MVDVDPEGRERRAIYLRPEQWEWLEATAAKDGTARSDLIEGLVLLAMDEAAPPRRRRRPGSPYGSQCPDCKHTLRVHIGGPDAWRCPCGCEVGPDHPWIPLTKTQWDALPADLREFGWGVAAPDTEGRGEQ